MLTIKLQNKKTGRTTIVECVSVDVVASGADFVLEADSPDVKRSYIVNEHGDYNVAFIENAGGHTTQIVRAMNGNGNTHHPRQTVR
jgi:hypothetical protein